MSINVNDYNNSHMNDNNIQGPMPHINNNNHNNTGAVARTDQFNSLAVGLALWYIVTLISCQNLLVPAPQLETDVLHTPATMHIWNEAFNITEERLRYAEEHPGIPLPPLGSPPMMIVKEESEREHLQRQWERMREVQHYLGLREKLRVPKLVEKEIISIFAAVFLGKSGVRRSSEMRNEMGRGYNLAERYHICNASTI
ncbi:hypothetical protein BDR07DRAFT_1375587 [Suillus spraguei]|nr:hypothetical protein BDR07DRAFT_1375587 [Suillus spraguei]